MTNENLLYKNSEFLKIKSTIWKEITRDCEAKIKSDHAGVRIVRS